MPLFLTRELNSFSMKRDDEIRRNMKKTKPKEKLSLKNNYHNCRTRESLYQKNIFPFSSYSK